MNWWKSQSNLVLKKRHLLRASHSEFKHQCTTCLTLLATQPTWSISWPHLPIHLSSYLPLSDQSKSKNMRWYSLSTNAFKTSLQKLGRCRVSFGSKKYALDQKVWTQNIFIDFLAELDHTKKIILLWQFVFNQACNSDIKVKIQLLEQISASCVVYTLQCLNSRLIGFGIFFNLGLSLLGPWDLRWALPSGLGVHNSCRWGCKTQYIPPLGSVRIQSPVKLTDDPSSHGVEAIKMITPTLWQSMTGRVMTVPWGVDCLKRLSIEIWWKLFPVLIDIRSHKDNTLPPVCQSFDGRLFFWKRVQNFLCWATLTFQLIV